MNSTLVILASFWNWRRKFSSVGRICANYKRKKDKLIPSKRVQLNYIKRPIYRYKTTCWLHSVHPRMIIQLNCLKIIDASCWLALPKAVFTHTSLISRRPSKFLSYLCRISSLISLTLSCAKPCRQWRPIMISKVSYEFNSCSICLTIEGTSLPRKTYQRLWFKIRG